MEKVVPFKISIEVCLCIVFELAPLKTVITLTMAHCFGVGE